MKFKVQDPQKYLLFDNTETMNQEVRCSEIALKRLEEEKMNERMIRPKISEYNGENIEE